MINRYCSFAIWYHLHNLKNAKNTHGGVLILVKLQVESCNFTKIKTPPWVFFTFLKLHKWYHIAQSITYCSFAVQQYKYGRKSLLEVLHFPNSLKMELNTNDFSGTFRKNFLVSLLVKPQKGYFCQLLFYLMIFQQTYVRSSYCLSAQQTNPQLVRLINSKTSGFVMFPGGMEMTHWREMAQNFKEVRRLFLQIKNLLIIKNLKNRRININHRNWKNHLIYIFTSL